MQRSASIDEQKIMDMLSSGKKKEQRQHKDYDLNELFSGRKVIRGQDSIFVSEPNSVPLLKDEEILELPLRYKFRCRHFDLGNEEDLNDYINVMELAANGDVLLCKRQHRWDADKDHMKVYVEWTVEYRDQRDRPTPLTRSVSPF